MLFLGDFNIHIQDFPNTLAAPGILSLLLTYASTLPYQKGAILHHLNCKHYLSLFPLFSFSTPNAKITDQHQDPPLILITSHASYSPTFFFLLCPAYLHCTSLELFLHMSKFFDLSFYYLTSLEKLQILMK